MNAAIYLEQGSLTKIDNFSGTVQITDRVRIFHTANPSVVAATTRWQHSLLPNSMYLYHNRRSHKVSKFHQNHINNEQNDPMNTNVIGELFRDERLPCRLQLSGFHNVRDGPNDTPSTDPSQENAASFTGRSR